MSPVRQQAGGRQHIPVADLAGYYDPSVFRRIAADLDAIHNEIDYVRGTYGGGSEYLTGSANPPQSANVVYAGPTSGAAAVPAFRGLVLADMPDSATAQQMLQSGGAGDPAYSTATWPTTVTANQILYGSGTNTVGGLGAAASSVLVTSAGSVPSLATDIPTAVTIGGAYVYRVGGTDVALADGGTAASLTVANGGIVYSTATAMAISAVGSSGQVLRSGGAGAPSWSTATFPATATVAGTILRADGTNWIATTALYPATTTVNQLLYSSAADTIAGLATLNSGVLVTGATGIPAIAIDLPTAITIGGGAIYRAGGTDVTLADGGTNASLAASVGGIVYSAATAMAILAGTVTAAQMLQSGASAAPAWSTATWPTTTALNRILYSSATNTVAEIPTANSGLLVTGALGVPSIATDIPTAVTIGGAYVHRVGGTDVAVADGGTGLSAGTSGGILGYTAAGTLASSVALTASALVLGGGAGATPIPLASLGTAATVLHGNAAGAPTWAAVDIVNETTGTLGIGRGGTGVTALSDVLGTANQVSVAGGAARVIGGNVTISLPQDFHTAATPQFARLGLGVAADANLALYVVNTIDAFVKIEDTDGGTGTTLLNLVNNRETLSDVWGINFGTGNRNKARIEGRNDNTGNSRGSLVFSTANGVSMTQGLTIDDNQNIVVGTAALSRAATDGFLYIPTMVGSPTGTPTSYTGRVPIVFDTDGNRLYAYDGGWLSVVLA